MIFISNKYTRIYNTIIARSKSRILDKSQYTEKHHILPKSFGGDNSTSNIAILTAREHFICHRLLVKMTTGAYKSKMIHALWNMCNTRNAYTVTSKLYEITKQAHSKLRAESDWNGKFIPGREAWNKGIPRTDIVKQAISVANKGRTSNRTSATFTDEWRKKISDSAKSRPKIKCPHCDMEAGPTNYSRWHGDKCRTKS